jgi:hypothetical protein
VLWIAAQIGRFSTGNVDYLTATFPLTAFCRIFFTFCGNTSIDFWTNIYIIFIEVTR